MKKLLLILLITHCSLLIATGQWVQANNGMGFYVIVNSLAYSGNNIFVGTGIYGAEVYGVFLSTNNGASWAQTSLNNQYVHPLAVNGNNIFVGTSGNSSGNGVYLSTNNGTTWTQNLSNQNITSLAVNGNNIFAAAYVTGVYLSTNNGTSWTQTSLNNQSVQSLAVNGNYIFAGTYSPANGVFVSTNNGTNWTQTSLNNQAIRSLAVNGSNIFAAAENNGVYLSTNNGSTWTQTSLNNQTGLSLLANGNNVFAGTGSPSIFYVSTNNGISWTQRNEGLIANTTVYAICILNNYIFAGTGGYSVWRRPLGELTGIKPISEQLPAHYALEQNYPNPFNSRTIINFQLPMFNYVRLIVYDILGRDVAILVDEQLKPGTYEVEWDASAYPSGVYFYKLTVGDASTWLGAKDATGSMTESLKMILLK